MYNEEHKQRFIRSFTQSLKTAKFACTIFNALEPFEKKWGADFCTRSSAEIQPAIDAVLGMRMTSKWSGLSMLRDYCSWSMASGYPGACDSMGEVNLLGLDKLRKQMVANPRHLKRFLADVFRDLSMETVDCVFHCYFWLAYSGVSEDDAMLVRNSDIDLSSRTIKFGGLEYPVYLEAIPALTQAITLDSFQYYHDNPVYTVYRPRVAGDTLLRGVKAEPSKGSMQRAVYALVKAEESSGGTPPRLTYQRAWLSGHYYRAYKAELIGIPAGFQVIAANELGFPGEDTKEIRRKARNYLEDYRRWKLAYPLSYSEEKRNK